MCGIAGIVHNHQDIPIDEGIVKRMLASIRHRGPDEAGLYTDRTVALGHVRLSIIGLDSGTQPIGNEDGSLWIVYNGEAFNYIELKEDLIKKGHVFSTRTDTEVILHLYEELGSACLEKINGQFAFAIWNARTRTLFMARDRVGIRPLYYCRIKDGIVFASEIKALFCHPQVRREIDPKALLQVFTFWAPLTPFTVFKGVQSIPPGQYMIVDGDSVTQRSYWQIPAQQSFRDQSISFDEKAEALKELIKDAVRLRLRADVPVGAYLSGGLDSSLITAIIAKHFNNRLCTFSIGFDAPEFDESHYQERMTRSLLTEHNQRHVSNAEIRDCLPEVVWHCEVPLLRTAPVPLFLLSRLVRDSGFKVVLTGEGADEIFGGYNIFREAKVRRFWGRRPESALRPLLLQKLYPYVFQDAGRARHFIQKFYRPSPQDLQDPLFSHQIRWRNCNRSVGFFSRDFVQEVSHYNPIKDAIQALPVDFERRDWLDKAQFIEMDIFLSNYLLSSQGDRVAMANSLEIRLPFLDHRVLDFAFNLPSNWKINGMNEKYILKHAAKRLIPTSICQREKKPYRAPIREAFFGSGMSDYVEDVLSERCLRQAGYFDSKKVGMLVKKFQNPCGQKPGEIQNMALAGILTTQLLHESFIERFEIPDTSCLIIDNRIQQTH